MTLHNRIIWRYFIVLLFTFILNLLAIIVLYRTEINRYTYQQDLNKSYNLAFMVSSLLQNAHDKNLSDKNLDVWFEDVITSYNKQISKLFINFPIKEIRNNMLSEKTEHIQIQNKSRKIVLDSHDDFPESPIDKVNPLVNTLINMLLPPIKNKFDLAPLFLNEKIIGYIGIDSLITEKRPLILSVLFLRIIMILIISTSFFFLVGCTIVIHYSKRISKPIKHFSETLIKVGHGDYSVQFTDGTNLPEIKEVSPIFNTMIKNIAERDRWHYQLLGNIAHEIRTPLTFLRGQLELLQKKIITPSEEVYESLQEEIHFIERVTTEIIVPPLDLELCNLTVLIDEIVNKYREKLDTREIKLIWNPPKEMTATSNSEKLKQVLYNLLENSYKYMEKPGSVSIELQKSKTEYILSLKNTGVPIPTKQLSQIFERFYRIESSRNRETGGQGIGLSLCRDYMLQLGGSIQALPSESGAYFQLVLPQNVSQDIIYKNNYLNMLRK